MAKPAHKTVTLTAALVGYVSLSAAVLAGEQRMALQLVPGEAGGVLAVTAMNGQARIADETLSLNLALSGGVTPDAAGYRVIASELYLKQAGRAAGATLVPLDGTPARTVAHSGSFAFAVDPLGPLGQDAVALCAGAGGRALPDGTAARFTMTVPVVWRVTTGRFNFRAFASDGVTPTEAVLANADYYAEQVAEEAETAAAVEVRCEPRALAAIAGAKAKPETTKPTAAKTTDASAAAKSASVTTETAPAVPAAQKLVADATPAPASVAAAPVTTAEPAMPVCQGGMVRETAGGLVGESAYVCLCPGHTVRKETSPGAFACARRLARGR